MLGAFRVLACLTLMSCAAKAPFDRITFDLNVTLARSQDEQLLLNLLRLRNGETPFSMQPSNISAQLEYSTSATVGSGVTIADEVGVSPFTAEATVGVTASPSVQWDPLRGKDLAKQYFEELSFLDVQLLLHSGWRAHQVFRLAVERIGEARNEEGYSGTVLEVLRDCEAEVATYLMVDERDTAYTRFLKLTCALAASQRDGFLEVVPLDRPGNVVITFPPPLDQKAALEYFKAGYTISQKEGIYELREPVKNHYTLRYGRPTAPEIRSLFTVDPSGKSPELETNASGGEAVVLRSFGDIAYATGRQMYVTEGECGPGQWGPEVEPPAGAAKATTAVPSLCLIQTKSRPSGAYVSVTYDNRWYSIDDDDFKTKQLFALVQRIRDVKASDIEPRSPILTLPIGPR